MKINKKKFYLMTKKQLFIVIFTSILSISAIVGSGFAIHEVVKKVNDKIK
ncbi:MAG: hypothetical protein ACRCW6_03155 [Mycoplasmoidaceae bacterium]